MRSAGLPQSLSLHTQCEALMDMPGQLIFVQELSATPAEVKAWTKRAKERGWDIEATPNGTNATGRGAGVGVAMRLPLRAVPWKPNTEEYSQVYDLGRAAVYRIEVQATAVIFETIYGVTGGHALQYFGERRKVLREESTLRLDYW